MSAQGFEVLGSGVGFGSGLIGWAWAGLGGWRSLALDSWWPPRQGVLGSGLGSSMVQWTWPWALGC